MVSGSRGLGLWGQWQEEGTEVSPEAYPAYVFSTASSSKEAATQESRGGH